MLIAESVQSKFELLFCVWGPFLDILGEIAVLLF